MSKPITRTIEDYQDILDRPRHQSTKHTPMPVGDRAAQFAPFQAVVGLGDAVKETARTTEKRRELDEMEKSMIDETLQEINAGLYEDKALEIVFFEPDAVKQGGCYRTLISEVKKIDIYEKEVVLKDGFRIQIEEIYSIQETYSY